MGWMNCPVYHLAFAQLESQATISAPRGSVASAPGLSSTPQKAQPLSRAGSIEWTQRRQLRRFVSAPHRRDGDIAAIAAMALSWCRATYWSVAGTVTAIDFVAVTSFIAACS